MSNVVQRSMMTISKLPDDCLEEILCRVPATILKKLKTSCKRWNCLFNNKGFAKKQFDNAAKQFLRLMLLRHYEIYLIRLRLDGHYGGPDILLVDALGLMDPNSSSTFSVDITDVIHCDGLLFVESKTRVAVYNPLTGGQSKWIDKANRRHRNFCFGYSQSKNESKSYKILNFDSYGESKDSEIYELSSDSWKVIDDDVRGRYLEDHCLIVCLNGDCYWFGRDGQDTEHTNISLHKFDFSTDKFGSLPLPYHRTSYQTSSVSVVREEKLAVLLQQEGDDSKTEVWLSNKLDETKVVSWSKVLAFDVSDEIDISTYASFLLDEEKKIVLCCDGVYGGGEGDDDENNEYHDMIYIIDEDGKVTQDHINSDESYGCMPTVLNYVPSLIQIDQARDSKRKRGG